jgi:hypothetical protein
LRWCTHKQNMNYYFNSNWTKWKFELLF